MKKAKGSFEYWATEHLRVSGAYWALAAMDVMNAVDQMEKQSIIEWLVRCQHTPGTRRLDKTLARAQTFDVASRIFVFFLSRSLSSCVRTTSNRVGRALYDL